jgi:hypothetical protein
VADIERPVIAGDVQRRAHVTRHSGLEDLRADRPSAGSSAAATEHDRANREPAQSPGGEGARHRETRTQRETTCTCLRLGPVGRGTRRLQELGLGAHNAPDPVSELRRRGHHGDGAAEGIGGG